MKTFCRLCCIILLIATQILAQQPSSIQIGDKPPALNLTIISHDTIADYNWDKLQGNVVILDFWATWCGPCIKSIPHMNKLVQQFEDQDVVFISLSYEPEKLITSFLQKYPMQAIVATDTNFGMFKTFDAWAIPLVMLVNKQGNIVGRIHPEHLTADVINSALKGDIPDVEQTPYNLFEAEGAEDYFRSFLKSETN